MKIWKYEVTPKNVKAYLQGKTRKLISKYGGDFFSLDPHIKEQIVWRETKAKKECLDAKECLCGCPIPDLFYADKTCQEECYPNMMSKTEWEEYKNGN